MIVQLVSSVHEATIENLFGSNTFSVGSSVRTKFFDFRSGYGIYLVLALAVIIAAIIVILVICRKKNSGSLNRSSIDVLTGLGNKKHACTYFNKLPHSEDGSVSFVYIAMDNIRFSNEYGIERSNELQKRIGELLSAFCGETDYASRIGEGEFVIGIAYHSDLILQQRLNNLIEDMDQKEADIVGETACPFRAGLVFASDVPYDFDSLMNFAVLAYNHACKNNINYYVCTKDMQKNEANRNYLRDRLNLAIDNNQFEMFLQFIYNVDSEKFTCAEVLSRWNDPLEGFLMPAYYIKDMRSTGVIFRFDMYMLDKTCRQLEEWNDGPFGELRLSCNITRTTISSPDFIPEFRSVIKKYRFDHSRLMLEITEDALIDKAVAYQNILDCKNDGVMIAIDDLGTGHSALEDIGEYPMDQVKLDRNIIVRTASEQGNIILKNLIDKAHRLNIEVVCEGVETNEQRDAVIKNGCDFVQGYLYSYVFPLSEGKEYYLRSVKGNFAAAVN